MKIPYFEVSAFTTNPFGGNPAGVCLLPRWLGDGTLQNIAAQNNLSETAFLVACGPDYELRWFTPEMEIDLCGHATLASAHVLFDALGRSGNLVNFRSRSGILPVGREGDRLTLNFPSRPPAPCSGPEALERALGRKPVTVLRSRDYLAVFDSEADIRSLRPDFAVLRALDCLGIIVTAPGTDCDFASRFFAPGAGIDEDPVTGSAHCTLIPYWAQRLGKTQFFARQVSRRGGELFCRLEGERVGIGGKAVLYLRGEIDLEKDEAS